MVDNTLKVIDFSSAIKSAPFNQNYELIHQWMKRERLRTSGYGLVEGFNMTYDGKFDIHISEGILIDHDGEEIIVPEALLACGEPTFERMRKEDVVVAADGSIELPNTPYSPGMHKLIRKDSSHVITIDETELKVRREDDRIPIVAVEGNKVFVSDQFAGQTVSVDYCYSADRVDAILVDEQGKYTREIGINAKSASIADYVQETKFLIGFAHWHIRDAVTVDFYMDERTYRKVYVDKMNRLYLNGKLYKEAKWIYFEEPKNPEENDIWYDYQTNSLSVWSQHAGIYGWRVINDFTTVPVRSVRMWTEEMCPVDLQTFTFRDDETDLRFLPNTNALEITIDQQVVMADQFEEVVLPSTKQYLAQGIGFKLKAPLDRPAVVQCTINHMVKNGPLKNVFQRAAIFTTENFYSYSTDNRHQIFETDLPYVIGASQLEVFVDGKRLNRADFAEMKDKTHAITEKDNGDTSKFFSVLAPLKDGQTVTYKISRYVWSYDQLNQMMEEIEKKAEDAIKISEELKQRYEVMTKNFEDKLRHYEENLSEFTEKLRAIEQSSRNKGEKIELSDLSDDVKHSLVKSLQRYEYNASIVGGIIYDCGEDDYVEISCQNRDGSFLLQKDKQYHLEYKNGNAIVNLEPEWMSPDNTIFASVIRIGRN